MKLKFLGILALLSTVASANASGFCSNGKYMPLLDRLGSGTINLNFSEFQSRTDLKLANLSMEAGDQTYTAAGSSTHTETHAGCFIFTTIKIEATDYADGIPFTLTIHQTGGLANTRCAGSGLVDPAELVVGGNGPLAGTHSLTCEL